MKFDAINKMKAKNCSIVSLSQNWWNFFFFLNLCLKTSNEFIWSFNKIVYSPGNLDMTDKQTDRQTDRAISYTQQKLFAVGYSYTAQVCETTEGKLTLQRWINNAIDQQVLMGTLVRLQ